MTYYQLPVGWREQSSKSEIIAAERRIGLDHVSLHGIQKEGSMGPKAQVPSSIHGQKEMSAKHGNQGPSLNPTTVFFVFLVMLCSVRIHKRKTHFF